MSVDDILPHLAQTQCRLCDYVDCRAYAEAIVHEGEHIGRCVPGGQTTLNALAEATGQDPAPYRNQLPDEPLSVAQIREPECIGCAKCLAVCPADAIIGSGKRMHTVITDVCHGCALCVPACPVDCIDMPPHPHHDSALEMATNSATRYAQQKERHLLAQQEADLAHQRAKKSDKIDVAQARKAAIAAALERHRYKKKE